MAWKKRTQNQKLSLPSAVNVMLNLSIIIIIVIITITIIIIIIIIIAVSDISARLLAQVSVKSVGRVQILDYSPVWRVQFSSLRNYLNIKMKNVFTLHFGKKIL